MAMANVNFSSGGSNYTATNIDIFMNNGAKIMFIKGGKTAPSTMHHIELSIQEWRRIKPQLSEIDYEAYYGRKPLMAGVSIYQVKQQ